jgi:hypothetical protein
MQQSFVAAIADNFRISGIITILGIVPILVLRSRKAGRGLNMRPGPVNE